MLGDLDHQPPGGRGGDDLLELGRQGGHRRDVERDVELGRDERQAADRLADGEQLQLGAEPDPRRFGEPVVGGARGLVRKAGQRLDADRAAVAEPVDRLVDHGDPVLLDHLGDPRDLLLLLFILAQLPLDLAGGEIGEGAHRQEVALGQRPVRHMAEAAEAAVDGAVGEAQRHIEVRADREAPA